MRLLKGFDEIDREKWEDILRKNGFSSPFQSPEYVELVRPLKKSSAEVYAVENNSKIVALCVVTIQKEEGLKAFFSRRGIIYGGPLIETGQEDAASYLIRSIEKDLQNEVIYLEVRNYFDYSNFKSLFQNYEWDYIPYLNVQIGLQDTDITSILSNMKSNRRREIRYSEEEGATTMEIKNETDLLTFFNFLKDLYSTVVKLPIPDYHYFLNLYNSSIGKIIGVYHNNILIGGAVCLFYPGKSIYTQYYYSKRDYHNRIYGTHLAIKGSIEFALKNNLRAIDLMGAGKPGEQYGVRKYKKQFGGKLVEHGRFVKVLNPIFFKVGEFGLNAMQKLNIGF